MPLSKRSAASITPAVSGGANAAAWHHDDPGPYDARSNHHDAAIGAASAIGAAMEAGAASAGGIRRAKARDRAGDQNRCEKIFHSFSLHGAAARHLMLIRSLFDTLIYLRRVELRRA